MTPTSELNSKIIEFLEFLGIKCGIANSGNDTPAIFINRTSMCNCRECYKLDENDAYQYVFMLIFEEFSGDKYYFHYGMKDDENYYLYVNLK